MDIIDKEASLNILELFKKFTKENEKLSKENFRIKQTARDRLEVIEELKEQNFKLSVENASLSARDNNP